MRVRPAAVAGRFYPADPGRLTALVDDLLGAVEPDPDDGPAAAVVAPHAGYRYSGAVAAAGYAHLARWRDTVDRVVVLGPAHFVPLRGMAVPAVDAFATPLGPVEVDADARTTAAALPGVTVDDRAHAGEHSLETQLPFLRRTLRPSVRVLPVAVGDVPAEEVAALLAAFDAPGTVAVVSTDLSHYLDLATARERDARTAAAVLAADPGALRREDACGYFALRGLLHHAAHQGLAVRCLRLATSADSAGSPDRVVGYGSFLITRPPAGWTGRGSGPTLRA